MLSCLEGKCDLTKYLIKTGADINALDNFKWTPLHFACYSGQLDIESLLLSNGAKVNNHEFLNFRFFLLGLSKNNEYMSN